MISCQDNNVFGDNDVEAKLVDADSQVADIGFTTTILELLSQLRTDVERNQIVFAVCSGHREKFAAIKGVLVARRPLEGELLGFSHPSLGKTGHDELLGEHSLIVAPSSVHCLQRVLDRLQNSVDIGGRVNRRKAVMAGAAAVVVEVDATSGRLAAELQHVFAAVAETVAIACHWLARAEGQAEAAAVNLEATSDRAATGNLCESA